MKTKIFFFSLLLAATIIACACLGDNDALTREIFFNIRLSRALCAALCGAALGSSGAVMQNVLRNPLADPYILGASSGAGVGGTIAIILGLSFMSPLFYAFCVIGAFTAAGAAYVLAGSGGKTPAVNLILAGTAINIFAGALMYLYFFFNRESGGSVLIFMMGSITEKTYGVLLRCVILFAAGLFIALASSRACDVLSLGEVKATQLGIPAEKLKFLLLFASSLMTVCAVVLAGAVGFVGLMVPHAARFFTGPKSKDVVIISAYAGAFLVLIVDTASRVIFAPKDLPVGILMALIGAPFFIWLLKRRKEEYYF